MKKAWFLLPVILFFSSYYSFAQDDIFLGIASQVYYDRLYDRTFDVNFQMTGTKALGMGGAHIAVADDPTGLLINPAGATQLKTINISAIGLFDINSREYKEPKNGGMKILSGVTPLVTLNSLSLALPVSFANRQIVAGFTYSSFDPMQKKIDDTHYYYGGDRISEIKDTKGGSYTLSPSLAVEIFPKFAVGAAYHYIFGESEYELMIRSPYALKTLYYGFEDKEKYSGSFMDFGLWTNPFKWFSIGLVITPAWKYIIQEKSESYTNSRYSSEAGFSYYTITTAEDSLDKFEIGIPLGFGVGFAINPISSITVAFDYRALNWSQTDVTKDNVPITYEFEDVKSYYVGMEYRTNLGSWQVPLRVGYYSNPLPNKDQWFDNNYKGKQITYNAFTFGCGLDKGHIEANLAYEHGSRKQSWWRDIGDYFNYRQFTTIDNTNKLIFSLSYKFNF